MKVLIVNKGNSNYKTNKNVMINIVETNKLDIMVVSEANLERDNKTLDIDFENHTVESKFLPNNDLARIMVVINKNITYERIQRFQTNQNAMIVISKKVNTGTDMGYKNPTFQWPQILSSSMIAYESYDC